METVKRYWLTGLAVLLGAFLLFLAVAIAIDNDPAISGAERAFGVIVDVVFGVALLGGVVALRRRRFANSVSLSLIGVGLIGGLVWFWMLIPPAVAIVVFWFGVLRGGLVRELTT